MCFSRFSTWLPSSWRPSTVQEDLQFTLILPPSRSCSGISWTLTNEKKKIHKKFRKKNWEKIVTKCTRKMPHAHTHTLWLVFFFSPHLRLSENSCRFCVVRFSRSSFTLSPLSIQFAMWFIINLFFYYYFSDNNQIWPTWYISDPNR
jgi:hypothetical protein